MCDGRSDRPRDQASWKRSLEIARLIYYGKSKDPTHGALWFHHRGVRPDWRGPQPQRIGAHMFYRKVRTPSA
jgi:spore germination cell wall hydrolase CwlJ-like protein